MTLPPYPLTYDNEFKSQRHLIDVAIKGDIQLTQFTHSTQTRVWLESALATPATTLISVIGSRPASFSPDITVHPAQRGNLLE